MTDFGTWLRQRREARGLSLRALAIQARTNHTTLARLESGQIATPDTDLLISICGALGVSVRTAATTIPAYKLLLDALDEEF
ncbi:transcriptional regulator with XRE-family HTH domain [Crossiella equi]|uniref:Transcriptional regulator with XRE-family HTH domain n=1 Tax=Crossiella equi TaxID=130796 RepID=A0ABS5AJ64_9PSEU|nr:helix-turn-helix transcriptional regulator [Crossiella equi]MBP2476617.1 transcriptional regulator with XRE-family HTH domain [Crossiella equi]